MTNELPPENPNPTAARRACPALENHAFTSVQQAECGLGPTGPVLCNWHLQFVAYSEEQTRFDWSHSDVGETGHVSCEGNAVRSAAIEAFFDDTTGELIWDDFAYQLAH